MLTRRRLLAAAALAQLGTTQAANQLIGAATPYGFPRRAWVAHPQLVQQQCPLWCWAASVAMIFASNGHPVNQQTIVGATFGSLACVASGPTLNIGNALSRAWVDVNGQSFTSTVTAAYDIQNGISNLTNGFIINELTNDYPLLYCNQHHAMVLVAMDYWDTPYGPNPQAGGVLDPWPYSPGFHPLTTAEMRPAHAGGEMTFLAAVRVT